MQGPGPLSRHTQASIRSYAVAVLAPAVALGIARWPIVHLESAPVSLFLCAVMLSAWLGGVGPGPPATGPSPAAFADYFLNPFERPRVVVFLLAGVPSCSPTPRGSPAMQTPA